MNGKKIYIAGKITDLDNFKERFEAADKKLRGWGAIPMNPSVLPAGFEHEDYMKICFSMIEVCDAVYFLNNWKESIGALMEYGYAKACGKDIYFEEDSIRKE